MDIPVKKSMDHRAIQIIYGLGGFRIVIDIANGPLVRLYSTPTDIW